MYGEGRNATVKTNSKSPALDPKLMIGFGGYSCRTQAETEAAARRSSPDRIMLGWNQEVPRWKTGFVITWAAYHTGYPTPGQATCAANQLNGAALEWNALNLGVQFKWVDDRNNATFVLKYRSEPGQTLAEAFIPNASTHNDVDVYQTAFDPRNIGYMKNIFLHELSHVLGLRHKLAEIEGDFVPFGHRNKNSVMSYNFPPTM